MNRNRPKRRRLIGPGTMAMIAGLMAFAVYSTLSKPSEPKSRYFEANAQGQLQEAERANVPAQAHRPLWKPEPKYLLDHASELNLTAHQRERIGSISASWEVIKADLEERLKLETQFLSASKKTSVGAVQSDLAGYSALSREFARQREAAWSSAVASLEEHQKVALRKISEEPK